MDASKWLKVIPTNAGWRIETINLLFPNEIMSSLLKRFEGGSAML